MATIIGLVAGILMVLVPIISGGQIAGFFSFPSLVLVLGGTIAATLINFRMRDVMTVLSIVRQVFQQDAPEPDQLIDKMVGIARISRREGMLALEGQINTIDDHFLKRAVQLAVDGVSPDAMKDILSTDIQVMQERHSLGQSVITAMAMFAPAFGMIGTLIGLIQMLGSLNEPSQIGRGMAGALLTTLYGALLANLAFLPILGKLKIRTAMEVLHRELIIEGILSVQMGEHPHILEQRLKAFLSPEARVRVKVGRP